VNPAPFEASAADLEGGIRVIEVRGELDLSTAPELARPLEDAAGETQPRIAIIVRAWQKLDGGANGEGRGRLVICSDNDQVRRILDITGLELSIPIHGTRDEALAALRG